MTTVTPTPTTEASVVTDLDAAHFRSLQLEKQGILLDVRTPAEVNRARIPKASVVDMRDPNFKRKVARMQKAKPIFVYCASGGRSRKAAEMLGELGFGEVYNLAGGIKGWERAGFDVDKTPIASHVASEADGAITVEAFDKLRTRNDMLLVDFHTQWCSPCREMVPIIDDLARTWNGKALVMRVDIDQSEALAQRERIEGVPVFVLYDHGNESWRHSGATTREVLDGQLAAAAAS